MWFWDRLPATTTLLPGRDALRACTAGASASADGLIDVESELLADGSGVDQA